MTEKKTTHTKEESDEPSLTGLLVDGVTRSVQSFVEGVIEDARRTAQRFTQRVALNVFLFCFSCIGILFLLIGFAQLLSAIYHIPGFGEIVMGVFVLLIVLVVSIVNRQQVK